jgi:MSHA biogenesis protein MshI
VLDGVEMKWGSGKKKREPGWLVALLRPQELAIAHGRIALNGKARIGKLTSRALEGEYAGAERLSREWHLERYRCATLLEPGDYQLLQVEAPNVPPAELKAAIRWRIKDLLDYHVDDATVDVLDIPPDPTGAARSHSMYAVAARNDAIQACIERFDAVQIPLSVIDIAETAQGCCIWANPAACSRSISAASSTSRAASRSATTRSRPGPSARRRSTGSRSS